MKKFSLIICFLGLLMTAIIPSADASECQTYCDDCSFCSGQFKVGVDWLYWKVEGDNLQVGQAVFKHTEDSAFIHFDPIRPKFQWESGYRVNVGYECGCWELGVYYTNLPTRAKTENHHGFRQYRDNFDYFISALDTKLNFLRAKWKTNINNIDIDICRSICFGECLKLRPHFGFRSLWIDEKYRLKGDYDPRIDTSGVPPEIKSRFREKFTGYGIEGGLWGDWQVGFGFSVVGHIGGSILYSKFRVHNRVEIKQIHPVNIQETLTIGAILRDHHHIATPTLDYFLGLRYEIEFCEMMLAARVGWEQHVFFDVNRFGLPGNHGNLTAQGVTLGAELSF